MSNNTITIPLSKTSKKYAGKYEAIISSEDTDLAELNWCVHIESTSYYALRSPRIEGKKRTIKMHRVILERKIGRKLEKGEWCDHIDGNGLNNTRPNLRLTTSLGNARNARKSVRNTSGYKGVSKYRNKWKAYIKHEKKTIHLGYFDNPEDAHKAYCEKAKELHGEFANFG